MKRQSIFPILKKAVEGFKLIADEKKIALAVKIPSESGFPIWISTRKKWKLALTNLLDNAIQVHSQRREN